MNNIPMNLAPGDRVRLLEGVFSRFEATVVEVESLKRLIHVSLPMHGQSILFEFTFDQAMTALERADD